RTGDPRNDIPSTDSSSLHRSSPRKGAAMRAMSSARAAARPATPPAPVESANEIRDRLVMEHVGLVKTLAQRLAQRLPSQVEISDLISVGVLGLIDAAARYKP